MNEKETARMESILDDHKHYNITVNVDDEYELENFLTIMYGW